MGGGAHRHRFTMLTDVEVDGDPERTREGLAALRAWFFKSIEVKNDPVDVTRPFPSLPLMAMIDKMDRVPPGTQATPPNALSVYDFYKDFKRCTFRNSDAGGNSKEALATRARDLLNIFPDYKTVPDINVGVRFLFHLSHALKKLTPAEYTSDDTDPCTVVDMPLDPRRLSHIALPCFFVDPSDDHKAMWADPQSGEYNPENVISKLSEQYQVVRAMASNFPECVKLGVLCPSCKCDSLITENMQELTESIDTYAEMMTLFCCPHCGLQISCHNPNIKVFFKGVRPRQMKIESQIKIRDFEQGQPEA